MRSHELDTAMCPSETLGKNPPLPILAADSCHHFLKSLVCGSIPPIKALLFTWPFLWVFLPPCVFTWLSYKDSSH